MTENKPITVYTADCIGNAANCRYPNEVNITDEVTAKPAFSKDMVCAKYKNSHRSVPNFETANALPMDCDNDHSDIPADWITPEDIAEFFAEVPYVLHFSRHHEKPKGGKGPRPRFHIVFRIDPEQDVDRYTALKKRLLAVFPFFDANATDAARFLFGTENPKVIYHPGTISLNAFLDDRENEQAFADLGRTIPFDEYDLPAFPVDALPEVIRRYVLAVAESTQTPVDMAAVEALGIVSLCCQGKYFIRGNADWAEPLNTYMVVIMEPAERKSSVLSMMIRPVEEYENEENSRRNTEIVESRMIQDKLEKEKRSLVERASKGKATEEEVRAKAAELAKFEPAKPLRLFVDDVTSEKLTSVLAENKGRAAVVSAEGGIFSIMSGLYNRNVNIDVFLKGHSGDTIRVDRVGRASESIIHPALTMVLAVQPEVLNGLMSNNTFRGRGLTARFLYSMPKSTVGRRSFSAEPIPEGVKARYRDLVETILSGNNEQEPISLDDGAADVLEALFNEVEGRLKGDLAEIPDWAGKFVGAVLRIGGILHVMKYPKDSMFDPVDRETMENAVSIGRYFLEHAKAAYSLMGADAVNKNARLFLAAVKRKRLAEFSRRDAMRLYRGCKTVESLQPVLDRLCEYGYLAVKPVPPSYGPGRKPSDTYLVNPAVWESADGEGRS